MRKTTLSYNARSGQCYGDQKRGSGFGRKGRGQKRSFNPLTLAQESFEKRSKRSQQQDLRQIAQIAPNLSVYLKNPQRYDLPFIDMPRDQNETITVLCRLAAQEPCEIHVKDTEAKLTKKVKVVKKTEANAEIDKAIQEIEEKVELAKAEPSTELTSKSHLPSVDEIYAEAVKMWQLENNRPGDLLDGVADPTRLELQEEGLLNQAKLKLMTSNDTVAERKTFDYVDNLRRELEKVGFTVIPMEGFSSEDLSY